MPIRFRCAYCNQLMGIARRKAGTVVRCPKCANQLMVPVPEEGEDVNAEQPRPRAPTLPAGEGGLFEQSDFGKVFEDVPGAGQPLLHPRMLPRPAANPSPVVANPPLAEYEAVPVAPTAGTAARGIFLTSGVLAVVCALGVILMGMAFFLGMLLGRSSQP